MGDDCFSRQLRAPLADTPPPPSLPTVHLDSQASLPKVEVVYVRRRSILASHVSRAAMSWNMLFNPFLWGTFLLLAIQAAKLLWCRLIQLQRGIRTFLDQIQQVDTLCATGKSLLATLAEVTAKLDSFGATSPEPRLRRIEHDMAEMKAAMYDMLRDMKDLRKIAEEAINIHDDLGNDVIDTHYELTTVIPELSRLSQLVKHRVDEQNFIFQCVFFPMDEQFLLLCDLANIIEEAIDPTCPYPFTLRLAHRPRGEGPRPRKRRFY